MPWFSSKPPSKACSTTFRAGHTTASARISSRAVASSSTRSMPLASSAGPMASLGVLVASSATSSSTASSKSLFPLAKRSVPLRKKKSSNGGITKSDGASRPGVASFATTAGMDVGKDTERSLIGSLIDSYPFKTDGLVKKTISITYRGVPHHLVSYYSVEDVMSGRLMTPNKDSRFHNIVPRTELLTSQNFRAPVNEVEYGPDGNPAFFADIPHGSEFGGNSGSILQRAWATPTAIQSVSVGSYTPTFSFQSAPHHSYSMAVPMGSSMPPPLSSSMASPAPSPMPPQASTPHSYAHSPQEDFGAVSNGSHDFGGSSGSMMQRNWANPGMQSVPAYNSSPFPFPPAPHHSYVSSMGSSMPPPISSSMTSPAPTSMDRISEPTFPPPP